MIFYKIALIWIALINLGRVTDCLSQQGPTEPIQITGMDALTKSIKTSFSPMHIAEAGMTALFKLFFQQLKGISQDCANVLRSIFTKSMHPKKWSDVMTSWPAQLLDSLAKPPSGVMTGNYYWLGSYQECIDIVVPMNSTSEKFIGEYCLVGLHPKMLPSSVLKKTRGVEVKLNIGLCFPSTCSIEDKSFLLNYALRPAKKLISVDIKKEMCQTKRPKPMDATTIIIICVLSSYGLFVLLATMVDLTSYMQNKHMTEKLDRLGLRVITSFSVIRSLRTIFHKNENSSDIKVIHGIRAISITWIITGHIILYAVLVYPWRNQADVLQTLDYFLLQPFMFVTTYSVTSFLTISGFLVTYLFIERSHDRLQSPSIFGYYLFRYIRLTPPLLFVILFLSGPFYHTNSGPIWYEVYKGDLELCRRDGWMAILYIQNFVNGNSCFIAGWYLSVDTQLYILAPIILYPLYRKPILGIWLMGIFFVASMTASIVHIVLTGQPTYFGNHANFAEVKEFDEILYRRPYYNAPSYIIGMATGYILHLMQKNQIIILKKIVVSCWICALAILFAILYGTYPYFKGTSEMSPWVNVLYGGFSHPAWALAVSWVILACALGYGGIVNACLTQPLFVLLGRLTFCAYLVHNSVVKYYYKGQKDGVYFSVYNMVILVFGNVLVTFFGAVILAVVIEMPIVNAMKQLGEKYDKPDHGQLKQLTIMAANQTITCDIHALLLQDGNSSQDENEYERK